MRIAIIFISLLVSIQSFGQTQSTLPAGAVPLSSQSYRSPNGDVWIGRDGMYYNVGSKAKTDSVFALIKVRDISQGANIVINKANPNNWVISSTGGGTGSADWGQIGGDIANQWDLLDSLNSRLSLSVFDPVFNTLSGDQLLRYNDVTGKWENFSPSWILPGSNISLLNNNAGYIVGGTAAGQVRTNADLDGRYIQTELDPSVPQYVKDISTGDISNWNSKISSVTGGTGITVDATDPYNLVVNADGGSSVTLTGDVTGAGAGSIATTITNNAVTTAKINDAAVTNTKLAANAVNTTNIVNNAVTLEKIQEISRGRLLGLGGGGINPWSLDASLGTGAPFPWSPESVPSGQRRLHLGTLYRSITTTNTSPPPNAQWTVEKTNVRGYYDNGASYLPGETIYYTVGGARYFETSSAVTGIAPEQEIPTAPGAVTEISLGSGFTLGEDNVLNYTGTASSITGMVQAGINMTRTGNGTLASPYIFNATGGGGGASALSALDDTDITGPGIGQVLTWTGGVWRNVNPSSATLFDRTTNGLVQAPGGSGIVRFLREDGTWVVPSGGGGGSDFRLRSGSNAYLSNDVSLVAGTNVTLSQSGQNITINATGGGGGGSVSLLTAGSSSVGAIRYAGVTKTNGQLYGGVSNPTNSTRLNYDGTIHAYDFVGYGLSDSTKKEEIVNIKDALKKINSLGGYRFKWKDGDENYSGYDYGLIAQEVEKVLPEAVVERNGVKAIRSSNQVISLLVEAVKELDNKVEDLELKYDSLLKRLEAIENEKK